MNINDKIRELNEEDKRMFGKVLVDNLSDENWCRIHKIDCIKPDYRFVKEKTYEEMYER